MAYTTIAGGLTSPTSPYINSNGNDTIVVYGNGGVLDSGGNDSITLLGTGNVTAGGSNDWIGVNNGSVSAGGSNDTVTMIGTGTVSVGGASDQINVYGPNDTVFVNGGNDTIFVATGNYSISVNAGTATIIGPYINETIGSGSSFVDPTTFAVESAMTGQATLAGGSIPTEFIGGTGSVSMLGSLAGNDTFIGGTGSDTMVAGLHSSGNLFEFLSSEGGGKHIIENFISGDKLVFQGYTPGDLHISTSQGNTFVTLQDGTSIELKGFTGTISSNLGSLASPHDGVEHRSTFHKG